MSLNTTPSPTQGIENEEVLNEFKDVATTSYGKEPLDSGPYAAAVAKSITEEMKSVAGMTKAESESVGGHVDAALKRVTADGDAAINQGDKDRFNEIRTGVSTIVGREVLPKIFERYGMNIDAKKSLALKISYQSLLMCFVEKLVRWT